MKRQRRYPRVRWGVASIRAVVNLGGDVKPQARTGGSIVHGNDIWTYDTIEEWLAEYDTDPDGAGIYLTIHGDGTPFGFDFSWTGKPDAWSDRVGTKIVVEGADRQSIEKVFQVFEAASQPRSLPVTVFIGHGRSNVWRELADILEKRFDVETIVFEYDERSGQDVRGVLSELLDEAAFAILVLTAEDETDAGGVRARQNVIHEVGLFQGRLGFDHAVVLLEDGCETFSNLAGTLYIPFPREAIEQAVGRVVSTLRREFGPI